MTKRPCPRCERSLAASGYFRGSEICRRCSGEEASTPPPPISPPPGIVDVDLGTGRIIRVQVTAGLLVLRPARRARTAGGEGLVASGSPLTIPAEMGARIGEAISRVVGG